MARLCKIKHLGVAYPISDFSTNPRRLGCLTNAGDNRLLWAGHIGASSMIHGGVHLQEGIASTSGGNYAEVV